MIEHQIEVGGARLTPYCLPHAYQDQVQEELRETEASGVIEPSNSEWAFPIVMMKKKDGSLYASVWTTTESTHPPWPLGKHLYLPPS